MNEEDWDCLPRSRSTRAEVPDAVELEANANTYLNLPVAAWFFLRRPPNQFTETRETGWQSGSESGPDCVQPLIVIKNVSDDSLKLEADVLRHSEVLCDAQVKVPVGQARDAAVAAVSGIQSENRVPEVRDGAWARR